jgi:hypothetical protein
MTGVGDLEHLLLDARFRYVRAAKVMRAPRYQARFASIENLCSKMFVPKLDFTFETFLAFGTKS